MTKLKIISYDDPSTRKELGSMLVPVNPETFNKKIKIKYTEKQASGTSTKLPKFSKIEPDRVDFDLLFDRTGVIPQVDKNEINSEMPGELGVDEYINKLRELTVKYDGKKHRPRFVRLFWGTMQFEGCLETMDVSYKLFDPIGLPLRATVKVGFVGSMDDIKRISLEDPKSPDLTHVRIVKEGDTLPLLCYDIYGDPKYYIEVAKFNRLNQFTILEKGQRLRFPPIEK